MNDNPENAKNGAKNLNLGLPLEGKQLKAFADMFAETKYFGHVKFGLENRRLDPEDLISKISEKEADGPGFLLLLGYLLRNGLDANHYFTGPYNVKIHLAVYINLLNYTARDAKYIRDLLISAGSSFSLPAYTGGRDNSKKTVEEATGYDSANVEDEEDYNLKDFLKYDKDINIKWKDFKSILLDQRYTNEDKKDVFDFLNKVNDDEQFLMRTVVLYLSSITGALDCLRESRDDQLFMNSLGNMNQAAYIAINSQNLEVFKIVIDKGAECNYLCVTEIIARHNAAGAEDDNILKDIYGEMLSYAVLTGSEIDSYQMQYLSLEASVELVEKITSNYEEPEWKKACKRTVPGDKKQFSVKKLRQIAFNLNLNFNLSPTSICDKLEKISNIDRLEYAKGSIERQEERVRRALIEVGDIREGDGLERTRCNAKSRLINNPYAYNDARMAFYRDDDGELWCFTSDLFEPMINSKRNPYTNKKLPALFLATITTQLNILKLLDLARPKDNKSVSQAYEETFVKKGKIDNEFSEEIYVRAVNSYRLNNAGGGTELDFRSKIITDSKKKLQQFVLLTFLYSISYEYDMFPDFVRTLEIRKRSGNMSAYLTIPPGGIYYNFNKGFKIWKLFSEAKYIENKIGSNFNELFYRVVSFNLNEFINYFNKGFKNPGGDPKKVLEKILKVLFP